MSFTQYAMVEELAFLVKDNLHCKHLVLSVEEALVNYLQDDASVDETIELEPMSSYNRLLLHRLAEIFGFAHESVGEGHDRHLVLKRCPDTSIPSILVCDILGQRDGFKSSTVQHQLLVRNDAAATSGLKILKASSANTLEEREEAYIAARERIFAGDEVELRESTRQRPPHVPVVARRMIAHALGQRMNPCSQGADIDCTEVGGLTDNHHNQGRRLINSISQNSEPHNCPETVTHSSEKLIFMEAESKDRSYGTSSNTEAPQKDTNKETSGICTSTCGKDRLGRSGATMKEESLGAAKRMFAHALGMQSTRGGLSRSRQSKTVAD